MDISIFSMDSSIVKDGADTMVPAPITYSLKIKLYGRKSM